MPVTMPAAGASSSYMSQRGQRRQLEERRAGIEQPRRSARAPAACPARDAARRTSRRRPRARGRAAARSSATSCCMRSRLLWKTGSAGSTWVWSVSMGRCSRRVAGDDPTVAGAYHPQQSVLKRQAGQRQTACIRYISAPQRSQSVWRRRSARGQRGLRGAISPAVDWCRTTGRRESPRSGTAWAEVGDLDMGQIMSWIDEQLVARGIRDPRVLDAMRRVPREAFVPEVSQPLAYADRRAADSAAARRSRSRSWSR